MSTISGPRPSWCPKSRKVRLDGPDRARLIDYRLRHPTARHREIAQHFGVDRSTVSRVLRQTWQAGLWSVDLQRDKTITDVQDPPSVEPEDACTGGGGMLHELSEDAMDIAGDNVTVPVPWVHNQGATINGSEHVLKERKGVVKSRAGIERPHEGANRDMGDGQADLDQIAMEVDGESENGFPSATEGELRREEAEDWEVKDSKGDGSTMLQAEAREVVQDLRGSSDGVLSAQGAGDEVDEEQVEDLETEMEVDLPEPENLLGKRKASMTAIGEEPPQKRPHYQPNETTASSDTVIVAMPLTERPIVQRRPRQKLLSCAEVAAGYQPRYKPRIRYRRGSE
ncbi:hypothetical protein V5O48_016917 [Marasmius crinis-equi]|uniref:Transposase n=1 Tax=Marasmius crinis-equi TaxID=585013 RepID=A0ABR3EQG7_9AGAR